jgi:hypothetical protein
MVDVETIVGLDRLDELTAMCGRSAPGTARRPPAGLDHRKTATGVASQKFVRLPVDGGWKVCV